MAEREGGQVPLYPSSQSPELHLLGALHAPMPIPCPICPNVAQQPTVGTLQRKPNKHLGDIVTCTAVLNIQQYHEEESNFSTRHAF